MATAPSNGLSTTNGSSGSVGDAPSAAAALMKRHDEDLAHKASIEEVEDEEDVIHPATHKTTPGPAIQDFDGASPPSWVQQQSEKAAGKQKAEDSGASSSNKENAKPAPKPLDLSSDAAFPSLGGSKPAAAAASSMWGNGKPASVKSNGISNGHAPLLSESASSRNPTQTGTHRPGSQLQFPGKAQATETIALRNTEMTPRNQLRKPLPEIIKEIQKATNTSIQAVQKGDGTTHFIAKGTTDAARRALRDLGKQLSAKVNGPFSSFDRENSLTRLAAF
jgi:hypothetical protein